MAQYGAPQCAPQVPQKSHRSRVTAGLLQIFLPSVGRFYCGNTKLALLQIIVTIFSCGYGVFWPILDGIYILTGSAKDGKGAKISD